MATTFREFLRNANDFAKRYPEALDYIVVYAQDEEGNMFHKLFYNYPKIGVFEDYNFYGENEAVRECGFKKEDINAVCIN